MANEGIEGKYKLLFLAVVIFLIKNPVLAKLKLGSDINGLVSLFALLLVTKAVSQMIFASKSKRAKFGDDLRYTMGLEDFRSETKRLNEDKTKKAKIDELKELVAPLGKEEKQREIFGNPFYDDYTKIAKKTKKNAKELQLEKDYKKRKEENEWKARKLERNIYQKSGVRTMFTVGNFRIKNLFKRKDKGVKKNAKKTQKTKSK
jgi:hypothetical protein